MNINTLDLISSQMIFLNKQSHNISCSLNRRTNTELLYVRQRNVVQIPQIVNPFEQSILARAENLKKVAITGEDILLPSESTLYE
jgi:hypothetical protein